MVRATILLTPEGRRDLEDELARREGERPEIAARIAEARAGGNDPTENLDLRDALDELALVEGRIAELKALLAASEPVGERRSDGVARLGARVRVRHGDGEEASYTLVSPVEADPRRGRVSVVAPIGRALLGHRGGEEVTAETPAGPERIVLLDVA